VDVMRYPDILEGEDAYNHLPGILKQYGYTTIEVGVPKWVDARAVNLLNGFDSVNGQPLDQPLLNTLRRYLGDSQVPYFLWTIAQRASARIQHIFFIQEMENPIEAVMDSKARMSAQERVDMLLSNLDQSNQPVYMIAHFMDTHGPEFSFQNQVYSKGDMKDNPWNVDFYDDAITGFDGYVEQIYNHLEERDMLDNTILIIYSDHGLKYVTNVQIPLIMHFPKGEFAEVLNHNSANVDIPATLLEFSGTVFLVDDCPTRLGTHPAHFFHPRNGESNRSGDGLESPYVRTGTGGHDPVYAGSIQATGLYDCPFHGYPRPRIFVPEPGLFEGRHERQSLEC